MISIMIQITYCVTCKTRLMQSSHSWSTEWIKRSLWIWMSKQWNNFSTHKGGIAWLLLFWGGGEITANQMTKSNWLLTYRLLGQCVTALLILYTGNPVVMYPSTVARGHWMCFCQMWRCLTVSTPSSMQPWRSWTQRQPRWLKTKSHFCPIMLKWCSWWKTSKLYSRTWRRLHLVNPVHPHDPRSDTLHVPYMFRSDVIHSLRWYCTSSIQL